MKYYKDPNTNEVYAYESEGFLEEHVKEGLEAITETEADNIRLSISISAFNNLTYAEKRVREYPDFLDYLDGIVKNDQAQIDAYIAKCKEVKEKYPKGTA